MLIQKTYGNDKLFNPELMERRNMAAKFCHLNSLFNSFLKMGAFYLISFNLQSCYNLVILAVPYLNDATCLNKVTISMNFVAQLVFTFLVI